MPEAPSRSVPAEPSMRLRRSLRSLSLRRRLTFIAVFAVLLSGALFAALLAMRSAVSDRLVERGELEAERALEQITPEPAGARLVSECSVGHSVSGTGPLRAGSSVPSGVNETVWAHVVDETARRGASRAYVALLQHDGVPLVVAARDRGDGSLAWAMIAIAEPPELRLWRLVALGLGAAVLVLLIASIDAVVLVRRAAARLGGAAIALSADLGAPIPRIGVVELEGVAEGLRSMAEGLRRGRAEREELHIALSRRERLAALGRVIAGVAHEIRNPLAAIKLLADLVREGGPEIDHASDLERLGQEVNRLDRLVSGLLVYTRGTPRAPVLHDVAALAAERASLLAPWAGQRRVSLRVCGAGRARIDVDATTRALDNLLRNAVEASPTDGIVEVEVSVHDGMLEVSVRDGGAGVPQARVAELFEPFFTTKPRGTGLGLALARAVARAHGGDLTFDHSPERTQFLLKLADAQ